MPTHLRVVLAGALAMALLVAGVVPISAVFRVPIEWTACADGGETECAWLEVPLDVADPLSDTLRLPLRRVRASDPEQRIGVLVTIAGGPGQRGTDWVFPGLHTPTIHERFDVVSWDPRGTSAGSVVDCIPEWDPFEGLDRTPDDDDERRAFDRRVAELADRCREEHGDVLAYIGTHEAALDLERLRQALRVEQVSILGTSYGSEVALTYATLFPEQVRAIVLDGYSDPNLAPDERVLEQARAFERSLDALLDDCAADPACPLGGDDSPGIALDALLTGLDEAPLATDDPARPLSQSDAHEAIAGSLLRGEAGRERLLSALFEATAGDGAPLLAIAGGIRGEYESGGLNLGTYTAIECADDGPYWERLPAAQVAELATAVQSAAPRLGQWLWDPPTTRDLPPLGLCAMLPFYVVREPAPVDAAGAGPVLVLTTSGDPTTPASAARRSTSDLEDAVVLTLDADHHLAYHAALGNPTTSAHRCVIEAVEDYLIDRRPPPAGLVCSL